MRKFITSFLVFSIVFSLVGPYFAEAKENAVDSSQGDVLDESIENNTIKQKPNSDSSVNELEESLEIAHDELHISESIKDEDPTEHLDHIQSNSLDTEDVHEATNIETVQVDETEEVKENPSSISEQKLDEEKEAEQNVLAVNPSSKLQIKESAISRLGRIKNADVKIYKDLKNLSSFTKAGSSHTNTVYHIKKQAIYNGATYYLLTTKPSSDQGVVGWVKTTDLNTHPHVTVDREAKTFYIKGTGKAYSKAWGGSKDIVYADLSKYKNKIFKVQLTGKVGNSLWYKGILAGKTVWIHNKYVEAAGKESSISRLGRIVDQKVKIYENYTNTSDYIVSGATYTNTVYHIKKQAVYNGVTYYLLTTKPSSDQGVVGWVKTTDLNTHPHVTIDRDAKTFYIKGTGKAYSKAWGGSKDVVYADLSKYKNKIFEVQLTGKIGNSLWYKGLLAGKTVWIHSKYVEAAGTESATSKLGHIKNQKVNIYESYVDSSSYTVSGATYTNAVYYIKKQAIYNGKTYYLLSTKPSSTNGIVGWVLSTDLDARSHVTISEDAKALYLTGAGKAYSKPWGGSKDVVYAELSKYQNEIFKIDLTEKVGNSIWYRGILGGKQVWILETYLHEGSVVLKTYTDYDITLNKMQEIQMTVSPQTDKRYKLWLRADAFKQGSIANGKGTVQGNKWNLRRGPGTNYMADGQVNDGTVLTIYDSAKDASGYTWYHVRNTSGWVMANPEDVGYYLTPTNFTGTLKDSMQFVKLSESANVNVNEVNEKILTGKGILAGKAQAFVDGGKANGVNEIYLIAHALLETGHGKSQLATGVEVGRDSKGNLVVANDSNRKNLTAIKKTYNMYGINAIDSNPLVGGATYAYEKGWFTPEAAIKGGAAFIGSGYVNKGQDTLYKMRWNPLYAATYGKASHQYATDIAWAYKQTSKMYELYQLLSEYKIVLDIPRYK